MTATDPVFLEVSPPDAERNRLTVLLRPLLAIPHALLVGGPIVGIGGGGSRTGVLGAVALVIALLDWFAVLITGKPLDGLQPLKRLYLRWRARALVYMALLRDEYPPFGERSYPAELHLPEPPEVRDRLLVALRPLLLLPHIVVLVVLMLAWVVVALVSWVYILITGRLAPELWRFGREVMDYTLRVEAYLLLVHDQFPAFPFTAPRAEAAFEAP